MSSLYKNYAEERTNKKVIETDKGFAVYSYYENAVYIEDIYVLPEYRKEGHAKKIADLICEEAKQKEINILIGSVDAKAKGADESVKTLLAYGMSISDSNSLIWFKKDI